MIERPGTRYDNQVSYFTPVGTTTRRHEGGGQRHFYSRSSDLRCAKNDRYRQFSGEFHFETAGKLAISIMKTCIKQRQAPSLHKDERNMGDSEKERMTYEIDFHGAMIPTDD